MYRTHPESSVVPPEVPGLWEEGHGGVVAEDAVGDVGVAWHREGLTVRGDQGDTAESGEDPGEEDGLDALGLRPPCHRLDRVDDGQETVHRHQNQRVDAHVRRRVRPKLPDPTPGKRQEEQLLETFLSFHEIFA